ncbi:MAG: phosphosulfolactate synthase [Desulfotomaculaceae bacterium]|nr:phosphosulfolactate synthase [Desulfotomaculaceae bacterium]
MGGQAHTSIWMELLDFPLQGRLIKPRAQGLTMVIDKGLGLNETKDLLKTAGEYIDFLKLGFGTSGLYPNGLLEDKINLVKSFGVDIYPGGTFLEIAVLQGKLKEYLALVKELGYTAVEISDGTVKITPEVREQAISIALAYDLKVLTEVGNKNPQDRAEVGHYITQILRDLELGAFKVILEGRESGKGAGFYDPEGRFLADEVHQVLEAVGDPQLLIWEAPLKQQQQELILRFGPNVNLGNIAPAELLSLEALRVGLRGDTLRSVLQEV